MTVLARHHGRVCRSALARAGQVFTVVLLFGGVGAALYTFTLLATVVVEGGLPKRLQRRRHERMLDTTHGSLHRLRLRPHRQHRRQPVPRQNVPFVVDRARRRARLQAAMDDGALAVEADASREDVLKRVGIERARGLIAAVGTDAENVYAVLSARVLRPDLFIVGRAETEDATMKLKRAGADRVISPYQIGAMQMAQTRAAAGGRRLRGSWRPARTTSSWRWRRSRSRPSSALAERSRFSTPTCASDSASSSSASSGRTGGWNSTPSRRPRSGAGDKLVVLGRPESLKRLEAGGEAALMAARLLDGAAVAQRDSRRVAPRGGGVHGARRAAARPRHRARRRRSGVGDLRAQQAEVGGGDRAARRSRAAAGDGVAGGAARRSSIG